jgi:hypothetical protein
MGLVLRDLCNGAMIESPRDFRRLQLLRVIHRVLPDPEG